MDTNFKCLILIGNIIYGIYWKLHVIAVLFVSFQSVLNFLNDPTGEMPWEEEDGAEDVKHIKTVKVSKYSKATCVFLRL